MQTSQLRQQHVALLHCHYCYLYYILTSTDIAFFFIENLHFSLISFMSINKSSVAEFDCAFLYHMTNDHTLVYTQYYQDFFVRPYFCESFSVFSVSVFVFSSRFFNNIAVTFSVAVAFCLVFSPSTVRPIFFSYYPRFSTYKDITEQFRETLKNQPQDQIRMVQKGP